MDDALNPHREQMADESMVRNLAAQAEAIWPQEVDLIRRYALPEAAAVLDAGCGTGEICARLARLLPRAHILGVDVLDEHLARGRALCSEFGERVRFEHRSVFELGLPSGTFDLTVCRHVLQAIPGPELALAELVRVTRHGGRLHLIPEDCGMLHFPERNLRADDFWHFTPHEFGKALGTDLYIGRNVFGHLLRLGVRDVTIDYVVVDPLRVSRQTFATILAAWRDGYADVVSENTSISKARFVDHFNEMIATLEDPLGYGVWMVPVVSATVP